MVRLTTYTSPAGNEWRTVGRDVTTTEGHIYEPITDGWAVGYRVTHADGRVEFIYLQPSGESDDATANVFVYIGPDGSPVESDQPVHHYDLFDTDEDDDPECDQCGDTLDGGSHGPYGHRFVSKLSEAVR